MGNLSETIEKRDAIDALVKSCTGFKCEDCHMWEKGMCKAVQGIKDLRERIPEPYQDNVNHPSHYTDGQIEVIDYIRDKLKADQFVGYCLGNVLKYVSRYDKKGAPAEDLKKARVYLGWAIERLEEEE